MSFQKVGKLKEQLGSMVNAMPVDENEGPTRQKILNLIQQGTSAISSTNKEDDQSGSEDEGPAPPRRKKTIFVDSVEKGSSLNPWYFFSIKWLF